jgi:transcriptional regulator NrdR family protein
MHCPTCNHTEHSVERTIPQPDGAIKRVRRCARCRGRWTTTELNHDRLQRLLTIEATLQPLFQEKTA